MADPKSSEDILGFEYDWIASDGADYVGFFATAGGGYAPVEFLIDTDAHHRAIETIIAMRPRTTVLFSEEGQHSTWTQMAERGVFAFDADICGGPYRLVAAPVTPLKVHEIPDVVAQVVRRLRFTHLRFADAEEISSEHLTNAKS
jgi:hypothetical protein